MELGVRLINLVRVPFIIDLFIARYVKIRITGRPNISHAQVDGFDHVNSNYTIDFHSQLFFQDIIRLQICKMLSYLQMADIEVPHQSFEGTSFFN